MCFRKQGETMKRWGCCTHCRCPDLERNHCARFKPRPLLFLTPVPETINCFPGVIRKTYRATNKVLGTCLSLSCLVRWWLRQWLFFKQNTSWHYLRNQMVSAWGVAWFILTENKVKMCIDSGINSRGANEALPLAEGLLAMNNWGAQFSFVAVAPGGLTMHMQAKPIELSGSLKQEKKRGR